MGALTEAGADLLLDGITSGGVWGSQVWAALSSTDPAVSVTEPGGGGYARALLPLDGLSFTGASGRQTVSLVDVLFGAASEAWGTLPFVAFFDAETGGSLLFHDQLPTPVVVASGDTPTIPAGGLVLSA